MMAARSLVARLADLRHSKHFIGWGVTVLLALAALGLFGRIMAFALRHDEQMYLPVGALLSKGDLYRDFGFNNLPNLPLLLDMAFGLSGSDHILLTGRLVIFAGWIVALAAMGWIVHHLVRTRAAAVAAVLLLATNPLLLGPTGMTVTNNFLPIACTLVSVCFLLMALRDENSPSGALLAASGFALGVAAGFKANYVFALPPFALALLLACYNVPVPAKLARVWPFVLGGIVGSLPVLLYAGRDLDSFLAHVVRYHREPHVAYWLANGAIDGEKVMTLAAKLGLAMRLWVGSLTVIPLLIAGGAAIILWRKGMRPDRPRPDWPLALIGGLAICAIPISFVPTPAFPQYFAPPVPFFILLAALLVRRLQPADARRAAPIFAAAAAVGILLGIPRLVVGVPNAFATGKWTGVRVHDLAQQLGATVRESGGRGQVATLAPVYVLEAGLTLYPELVTGPLVYRVGDLIPPADRRFYRLVSPTTLAGILDPSPPDAILVGFEGALDEAFADYAMQRRYRPLKLPALRDRYGEGTLYLRPLGPPYLTGRQQ